MENEEVKNEEEKNISTSDTATNNVQEEPVVEENVVVENNEVINSNIDTTNVANVEPIPTPASNPEVIVPPFETAQPQYEMAPPQYEEVQMKPKVVRTDSYFDGGLLELIGWRILAFLVTAVTLGIAYPWAACMLYNYQFKHTVYNGKRLKFEGTGGDLFVNMFKWVFFSLITCGIYLFFVPVRKTKWVISNLHFEDEPHITGESYFDGNTLQLIPFISNIFFVKSYHVVYPKFVEL